MEFRSLWKVQLQRQSAQIPCYSLCFKPDYSQLIVASSNDLFFLDPKTGEILDQKRSHQAPIYCVRCSYDGAFFASSSSDGTVVIWRSFNNDGFVTYGSQSSARHLVWSPNKQLLISCSAKEYNMWRPDDQRASRKQVKDQIEGLAFSPNGEFFMISYATGVVNVLSAESQEVVQTFNYSSIVTSTSFVKLDSTDYIIITDLDCKVSMFRASDKCLVGKNGLPFEALCSTTLTGTSFFFAFAGIGGKVSLLSPNLSYLGDFDTDSKWIWDMDTDKEGRIAIATREGFVELRSIEFGLAFACSKDVVAYRTSINAMSCYNVATGKSADLNFVKIIISLAMSSRYLLVQFKDSVIVYRHERDEGDPEDPDNKMQLIKTYEIPGSFEQTLFAITRIHIFSANGHTLTVFDMYGRAICTFTFQSAITSIAGAVGEKDGSIVSCADGCVYCVILDQQEPVLLVNHSHPVTFAQRQGLNVAVIDNIGSAVVYDTFGQRALRNYENVRSFAFSDRIDNLYATSDGSSVSVVYKECTPMTLFVEGSILGFVRNHIVLSNEGSLEIVDAVLPLEEIIENEDWDDVVELMSLGLIRSQWQYIATEALKKHNLDIAKMAAPYADLDLSFFVNEVVPVIDDKRWNIEVGSFLGEIKHSELVTEDGNNATRANELEAAGVSEEALQLYASMGDWDNVLRLAKVKHLERCIVDYQFPANVSEEAARVLLDAGLGDGAIRILTKTQNVNSLARAHMFLGQWPEAISLSRLHPSVYNIIYPRFGQLLFENGQWFESLVCFFIPRDREERAATFDKIFSVAADACACDRLSFVEFMSGLNDPDAYWLRYNRVLCYHAAHRLKNYVLMPMSQEDAETVFYLSYFVMACVRSFPVRGINVTDVLIQLLTSASILGQKRWLAYALKELGSFEIDDTCKLIAQRAVRFNKEFTDTVPIGCACPRCGKDFYAASRFPLLVCGFCGMRTAFSCFSCKALPLVPFEYRGTDALELIELQPTSETSETDIPRDVVSDEYLRDTPAEYFIVQKLKEKSGVPMRMWFNGEQKDIRACKTCGSLFTEEDYENSALESETCPICKTVHITEEVQMEMQSDILELLRSFEEESPVYF